MLRVLVYLHFFMIVFGVSILLFKDRTQFKDTACDLSIYITKLMIQSTFAFLLVVLITRNQLAAFFISVFLEWLFVRRKRYEKAHS